jgi:hypothetical protein
MKRLPLFACVVVLSASVLRASPVPDFWYVVPDAAPAAGASAKDRGIVIPSSVNPTIETTPAGSVLSWLRSDGSRRSFVVQGLSSLTVEPGPLVGTTYVPFRRSRQLAYDPRGCCACASWENSVESVESLSCVAGCYGCGCEGCICSPTFPCPNGPDGSMTLVAQGGLAPAMRFDDSGARRGVTVLSHGGRDARFLGRNLTTRLTEAGETVIANPESIVLPGRVVSRAEIRGDHALFAWASPGVSVIVEQPRSMRAPSYRDGNIDLGARPSDAATTKRVAVAPVMDRCSACGTHPNSDSDLDLYDCVPGSGVCYRCVSWECLVQES